MYRSGELKPPPITTFSIADIAQAYHYFSSRDRIGKVVISLENPESIIPVSSGLLIRPYEIIADEVDRLYLPST